jgi:hypothetical protein
MKTSSVMSYALAAAVTGLLGGTAAAAHAQTANTSASNNAPVAGVVLVHQDTTTLPKHSCKGKNDCKGQGGGKHPGKNSCKGKGGCATDGSKPSKTV